MCSRTTVLNREWKGNFKMINTGLSYHSGRQLVMCKRRKTFKNFHSYKPITSSDLTQGITAQKCYKPIAPSNPFKALSF